MECTNCNEPIQESEARIENPDGTIFHVDCYPEVVVEETVEE